MNRTKLILLTVVLLFAGGAAAQQQQLKMPSTRMSVTRLFNIIREQTGMGVAYNADQLDASRRVELPAARLTVEQALAAIDAKAGMRHKYNGRMILLSPAPKRPQPSKRRSELLVELVDRSNWPAPEPEKRTMPESIRVVPAAEQSEKTPISNWRQTDDFTSALRSLPHVGIKTNLLYGFGTLTPNLAVEVGLGKRTSLEMSGSYNPWRLKGSMESNRKLVHALLRTEFRYWFCERFNGHFLGAHALFGRYNIGTYDVPGLFEKKYRYDGIAYGGGITYGYNWMLGKRWNLELAAGLGVMQLEYDRFDCAACDRNPKRGSKTWFGPTNAAINIVFLLK